MAISINQFDQTLPITGKAAQAQSIAIQNWFTKNAGSMRPVGVPVATVPAVLIARGWGVAGGAAQAAGPGPAAVVAAAGVGPAAVVAPVGGIAPGGVAAGGAAAGGVAAGGVMWGAIWHSIFTQVMAVLPTSGTVRLSLNCFIYGLGILMLSIVLFSLCQILSEPPEKPFNKSMGFFEQLHVAANHGREHENGFYWLFVLLKLCIVHYTRVFYTSEFVPWVCRLVYVLPTIFRAHEGWDITAWVETGVLCCMAQTICSQPQTPMFCVLYFTKFLLMWIAGTPVNSRLLWEFVYMSIFSYCSKNKTFLAIVKFCLMFFKSLQELQETNEFLGIDSIVKSDDGVKVEFDDDDQHPLRKLPYSRDEINNYWRALLLPTRTHRVYQSEIDDLWIAHHRSLNRQVVKSALQILISIRPW
jgi:hypothetical protein